MNSKTTHKMSSHLYISAILIDVCHKMWYKIINIFLPLKFKITNLKKNNKRLEKKQITGNGTEQ